MMSLQTLSLSSATTLFILLYPAACSVETPLSSLSASNWVLELMTDLDHYIIINNTLDLNDWNQQLKPTPNERAQWIEAIQSLLRNSSNCSSAILGPDLQHWLTVIPFPIAPGTHKHCVMMENRVVPNPKQPARFAKGWGIFVANMDPLRPNLHISAAHPISDGKVELEAATIYEQLHARSLLIAGADRFAIMSPSPCQNHSMILDAAHANYTMFHSGLLASLEVQNQKGCQSNKGNNTCLFMQFHGMAETSCSNITAFLSVGETYNRAKKFYDDPTAIVNQIASALRYSFPANSTIATVGSDHLQHRCGLAAETNVFGRVVNNVETGRECFTRALTDGVSGHFLHVEQKRVARSAAYYPLWIDALQKVFS